MVWRMDKADAEAIGATEEALIRTEFIKSGDVAEPLKTVTIKNCIDAYQARPGGRTDSISNVAINSMPTRAKPCWAERGKQGTWLQRVGVLWNRQRPPGRVRHCSLPLDMVHMNAAWLPRHLPRRPHRYQLACRARLCGCVCT